MPAPSRKAPHNPLPLLLHCSLERASLSVGHVARLLHKPHKSGRFMLSSGHHDDRAEVRNAVKFQRGCFCLNKGPFLRDTGLGSGICGHSPAVDTKLLGSQTQSHSRQRPFPPRHWLRFRDLWSRPCGGHEAPGFTDAEPQPTPPGDFPNRRWEDTLLLPKTRLTRPQLPFCVPSS